MRRPTANDRDGRFVQVARFDELLDGSPRVVRALGRRLIVVRDADGVLAADELCPHAGASLGGAEVDRSSDRATITCPMHHWSFELGSGRCLVGGVNLPTYATRIVDGFVQVELPEALLSDDAGLPPRPV